MTERLLLLLLTGDGGATARVRAVCVGVCTGGQKENGRMDNEEWRRHLIRPRVRR